jgi:hypothetical protein
MRQLIFNANNGKTADPFPYIPSTFEYTSEKQMKNFPLQILVY